MSKKIKKKEIKRILKELLNESLTPDIGAGEIEYHIDGNKLYNTINAFRKSL